MGSNPNVRAERLVVGCVEYVGDIEVSVSAEMESSLY